MKCVIGLDEIRFGLLDGNMFSLFVIVVKLRPQIRDVIGEVRVSLAFRGKYGVISPPQDDFFQRSEFRFLTQRECLGGCRLLFFLRLALAKSRRVKSYFILVFLWFDLSA